MYQFTLVLHIVFTMVPGDQLLAVGARSDRGLVRTAHGAGAGSCIGVLAGGGTEFEMNGRCSNHNRNRSAVRLCAGTGLWILG